MKLPITTGIEYEIGVTAEVPKDIHGWIRGTDQSAGWEWKSGVLRETEEVESIRTLVDEAKRVGRIHDKCGIHIHLGFDIKQVPDMRVKYRLMRLLHRYEDMILDLEKPHANRACFCAKLPDAAWEPLKTGGGFGYFGQESVGRYWWVNPVAIKKYGTLEFRFINTTYDWQRIVGWVHILQSLLCSAISGTKVEWEKSSDRQEFKHYLMLPQGHAWNKYAEGILL
jgi:hypothetical protein